MFFKHRRSCVHAYVRLSVYTMSGKTPVSATLVTIHDDDGYPSATKQDVLTALRQKKLLKETNEVSLLLSTMNIYANCPGIDRMISELGKNIAFCKYFFTA